MNKKLFKSIGILLGSSVAVTVLTALVLGFPYAYLKEYYGVVCIVAPCPEPYLIFGYQFVGAYFLRDLCIWFVFIAFIVFLYNYLKTKNVLWRKVK
ncbi:MAG: hypothetical protein WCP14_01315 [bacterium]